MTRGVWLTVATMVVAATMLTVPATAAAPAAIRTEPGLERAILVEVNALRRAHGLATLRASGDLAQAAEGHSRSMAQHGFFAHSSRDGTIFWKRIARSYTSAGYAYWTVGENLLWSTRGIDAKAAVRMWLNSPPHRRVLLTGHWRELGVSAVRADAAPGAFGGEDVTIVTADFGRRR